MLNLASIPARLVQRRTLAHLRTALLLLLIALPPLLIGLSAHPAPWFDEGFKMNSARLLAERGIYGSRSAAGVLPFDMGITSGPLEVGVMALSYRLFGLGVAQGRAAFVLFALLELLFIYLLVRDLRGHSAGLTAALLAVAIPPVSGVSLLLLGRQAMAEAPAAAMILLGLWLLLRAWREGRTDQALFAGLACGIGLLSKSQFGLALMPALALVGLARWLRREDSLLRAATPSLAALAVFFGWSLLGQLGSSPAVQHYNREMLRLGISTNLITDLFGRWLRPDAMALAALCLAGAGYTLWRMGPQLRSRRLDPSGWMLVTLAAVAVINTIWFALVSVGWPRYSYLGYVAALPLLGLAAHDLLTWVRRAAQPRVPRLAAALYPVALAGMVMLAWLGSLPPALAAASPAPAEMMAAYIERELPRSALIESWEWEIDALGAHTRFHHPHQRYVYVATFQQSHNLSFRLDYDPLQADPDYLLAGSFSDWTALYPAATLEAAFTLEVAIGPYRLYRRLP